VRDISQIHEMVKRSSFSVDEVVHGFAQLGEALSKAMAPIATWNSIVLRLASDDQVKSLIDQFQRDTSETLDHYYRDEAEPADVVQYILQQPDHTWMGVTIYPDEAWRYACKSDWMWWRE